MTIYMSRLVHFLLKKDFNWFEAVGMMLAYKYLCAWLGL